MSHKTLNWLGEASVFRSPDDPIHPIKKELNQTGKFVNEPAFQSINTPLVSMSRTGSENTRMVVVAADLQKKNARARIAQKLVQSLRQSRSADIRVQPVLG